MPSLVTVKGPNTGRRFPLDEKSTIIGRQPGAAIYLESLAVSRYHARIVCEEGAYFVEDTGSSNGTYINGHRIAGRVPLGERDLLQIGPYELSLLINPTSERKEVKEILPKSVATLEKVKAIFQKAGLAFPTIPDTLAAQLKVQGAWLFSTRELKMSPYNLQHYVNEGDGDTGEYAVLSHSGHGTNSYAIQYYLVYGPLRMFLHLGWGGVYMDADAAASKILHCFSLADEIVLAAKAWGKLGAGERLTIVGSDVYGSYWFAPGQSRQKEREDSKGPVEILTEVLVWLKNPLVSQPLQISPAAYTEMFSAGRQASAFITGVCGRVVRGRKPQDFDKLSFAEGRRLAWVMGPRGMRDLLGKRGAEIVLGIGKSRVWLQEKLAEGMRWKLVVIPQAACRLADWDGLFALIAEHYPELAPKLLRWAEPLKDRALVTSIDKRMIAAEVKDDVRHSLHLSVERYLCCDDTLANARLFLWHSLGVNDLFTGDGYTAGPDGTERVEEYLVPNRTLADLADVVLLDLDVT